MMPTSTFGQIGIIPGSDNFVSWSICTVTGSHSRHAVIGAGGGTIVSAEPGGVRRLPAAAYPTAIWSKFDLTWAQAAKIAQFALAQVDKPYAFWDDALIGFERIFRCHAPLFLREKLQDDGQWQCAELADMSLRAGGVNAFPGTIAGDRAPGDFEELYIARNWHKLEEWTAYPMKPWK